MKPQEHLDRAAAHLETLKSNIPTAIHPFSLSRTSKSPFKAESLAHILTYRAIELSESALELLRTDRILCGVILTRAVIETVAMHYWLLKRLNRVVETRRVEDIDDFMMRMLFGCRNGAVPVEALNVLTAIQHLDKDDAFKKDPKGGFGPKSKGPVEYLYDRLSEWAHPNFDGGLGAYAQIDKKKQIVKLRRTGSKGYEFGSMSLGVILEIFSECQRLMEEALSKFSASCEEDSKDVST